MHPVDQSPPETPRFTHIVTLKDPSKTAAFLSKKLNLVEKGAPFRGTTLLASDNGRHAHHFHKLGMVAISLTDDELRWLPADDNVHSVRRNRPVSIAAPEPEPDRTSRAGSTLQLHDAQVVADYLARFSSFAGTMAQLFLQLQEPGAQPPRELGAFMPRVPAVAPVSARALEDEDDGWSWALRLVGINPGYSVATGKGVKVAVLDTGVDLDHPDFADCFTDPDSTESFIDNETVDDGNGHGTHVAGIIAGAANSSGGVRYSVAPNAELLIGKVLNNRGKGFDDNILAGIAWAAALGARVINLSLSSTRELDGWFKWDYEVLAERVSEGPTPAILVAAAGNRSNRDGLPATLAPVDNPAAAPSIIAVAACDADMLPGSFSNAELDTIGRLDVTAPGVAVYSAYNDGSFRRLDGTSMAAPHVSGLAALRLELNPELSPAGLRAALRDAVRSPPRPAPRRDYGHGLAIAP